MKLISKGRKHIPKTDSTLLIAIKDKEKGDNDFIKCKYIKKYKKFYTVEGEEVNKRNILDIFDIIETEPKVYITEITLVNNPLFGEIENIPEQLRDIIRQLENIHNEFKYCYEEIINLLDTCKRLLKDIEGKNWLSYFGTPSEVFISLYLGVYKLADNEIIIGNREYKFIKVNYNED